MGRPAVIDPQGAWGRSQIAADAASLAEVLADVLPVARGEEVPSRVALVCRPGRDFLVALLACWDAGAVAVPLHPAHPVAELAGLTADADISAVVCSSSHSELGAALAGGRPVLVADEHRSPRRARRTLGEIQPDRPALVIFTSGTTGRPKGVVHTHRSLGAQISALLGPWGWSSEDRALLVLPLHHVHGIVAVVLSAWAAGATCEAPGRFDAEATWARLATGEVTVLMAVPTIYTRLIATWDEADPQTRRLWSAGARAARLFVSGSAALPLHVLERWHTITGHTLLERYGMTEFGLALSNTLTRRVPGHVGEPLPGFEVRLVDDDGRPVGAHEPGSLEVRGAGMFSAYWNRPEDTAAAFTDDGWFRTGDVAIHDEEGYRLLGRSSVDIIKTGGEKVSAIEIEDTYRQHPAIADCAVVGLPDDEWGQRVVMAVISSPGTHPEDLPALRTWGKQRLAPAKVPVEIIPVTDLPRNAMGKVTKPALATLLAQR